MGIVNFAHTGLFVNDMKKSVKFYTEVLGFELVWEAVNGEVLMDFIKLGDGMLELVQLPGGVDRSAGWFDHIAFEVKDLDATRKMLEEKGVVFDEGSYEEVPVVWPNGAKWIFFTGPDGEKLEITEVL